MSLFWEVLSDNTNGQETRELSQTGPPQRMRGRKRNCYTISNVFVLSKNSPSKDVFYETLQTLPETNVNYPRSLLI